MDNTVTREVFKRIDVLAEKLGTTAAYLWPKLVAWETGKAIGELIAWIVLPLVCGFVLMKITPTVRKSWTDFDNELAGVGGMFVCVILAAIAIVSVASFIVNIGKLAGIIASPEAAAFYRLVGR